jgi:hypothetical protein
MVRSVVSKVMWVGRATVFLVGLAVILAVVFGMVSRATAHTGSAGLFHLNHNNPVTALSTLTGTLSGSVLKVDNNGTGTALFLETASGKPPLQVPSTAGKASNLNADKLDGREASSFANGVGGKATDADKLDGNDSSAFVKNTGTMTFSSFGPWKSLGTTAPGPGDPTAAIVDDGLPHVTQFTRPNTNPATSSVILVPDTVP